MAANSFIASPNCLGAIWPSARPRAAASSCVRLAVSVRLMADWAASAAALLNDWSR